MRDDITFINRKTGSGTRLWLDHQLKKSGIPIDKIHGYAQIANTHAQVAFAIERQRATAGLGVYAAARQYQLDFIPLFEERFDLVFPADSSNYPGLVPVLDLLQASRFRKAVQNLGGYTTTQTGDTLHVDF